MAYIFDKDSGYYLETTAKSSKPTDYGYVPNNVLDEVPGDGKVLKIGSTVDLGKGLKRNAGGYLEAAVPTAEEVAANRKALTPSGVYGDTLIPSLGSPEADEMERQRLELAKQDADINIDESVVRNQTTAAFQAEIDAINKMFADELRRAQVAGADRLGQATAIQSRRGLIGSDFGTAQTDKVKGLNEEIYQTIEAEKLAKISAIEAKIRDTVSKEIKERRAAKLAGVESYLKYLGEAATRKTTNAQKIAQAILDGGEPIENISADVLERAARDAGISVDDVKREYNALFKAKQAAAAENKMKNDKTLAETEKLKAETEMLGKNFEENKRKFGLDYALKQEALELQKQKAISDKAAANAKAGLGPDGKPLPSPLAEKALGYATNLKNTMEQVRAKEGFLPDLLPEYTAVGKTAGGPLGLFLDLIDSGTKRSNFIKEFDALKSSLSLKNVQFVKGQGTITDAERKLLADVELLDRTQTPQAFYDSLLRIIGQIEKLDENPTVNGIPLSEYAASQVNTITSPDGTEEIIITD